MKMTKKIMSLAIVFAMVMAMSVSVFAQDVGTVATGTGSITLEQAVVGQTYELYRVFDATYTGTGAEAKVSYTTTNATLINEINKGQSPFTLTQIGTSNKYNVAVNEGVTDAAILQWIENNASLLTKVGETVTATETTINFLGLPYGYYFIKSSLGATVTIDSNLPNVTVIDKNSYPTLDKKVWNEDKADAAGWDTTATADMTESVQFQLTVDTEGFVAGDSYDENDGITNNFVIEDTLPSAMTYVTGSVAITGWTVGTDYTVGYTGDVLTITLMASKLKTLTEGTEIVITYNATVDHDAVVDTALTNTAKLTYGTYVTANVSASVMTFDFSVFKYTGNDQPLANATFTLSKNANGSAPIAFINSATNEYKVCTNTDVVEGTHEHVTEITTDETGKFAIKGLDAGTYYLTETVAPDGYNILTAPIEVKITTAGVVQMKNDQDAFVDVATSEIPVENQTGTELPSTGGIGTTIFYALGGLMAVGAGVLLVAKKRMEA